MTGTVDEDRTPEGSAGNTDGAEGEETVAHDEASPEVYYCDLCGSVMLNLHCKLICETCGYKRDCSDP